MLQHLFGAADAELAGSDDLRSLLRALQLYANPTRPAGPAGRARGNDRADRGGGGREMADGSRCARAGQRRLVAIGETAIVLTLSLHRV